jgi:hypothetical protein
MAFYLDQATVLKVSVNIAIDTTGNNGSHDFFARCWQYTGLTIEDEIESDVRRYSSPDRSRVEAGSLRIDYNHMLC